MPLGENKRSCQLKYTAFTCIEMRKTTKKDEISYIYYHDKISDGTLSNQKAYIGIHKSNSIISYGYFQKLILI